MTDAELRDLYNRRAAAWDALTPSGGRGGLLGNLSPDARRRVDAASAQFRACDAAIVAELRTRDRPAKVGDVTLRLTADRLSFAVLKGKWAPGEHRGECYPTWSMLHDYEAAKKAHKAKAAG